MENELKKQIIAWVDSQSQNLWGISQSIFHEPEIAFKEYKACKLLTEALNANGFSIETGIGGLETAFRATHGESTGPKIAILAEYDALVGLGHSCGHNLIAAAALGAGMALAAAKPSLNGQIQGIGTPAAEGGGGKILLANAGIFDSVDGAMK